MPTIRVNSSAGPYEVYCSRGALSRTRSLLSRLREHSGVFVLSSPRVWRHWREKLTRSLSSRRAKEIILFDDQESTKRLSTVEEIARKLSRAGADRHSVIVALGGGVVGDVAGFVAATYLRGVRLVHIPTTLVAQVDSAIGGKTGVNLPEGKNLVGAFHPPKFVIVDPDVLRTLPHRQYRSGLYEVIKYGVIADANLFRYLERRMLPLLLCDPAALNWVIPRCIRIKARVVSRDEREGGLRQILNFGHTLGHALEAATGYRRFLHGEAIGWGMYGATLLAVASGRLRRTDAARIVQLTTSVGPLPDLPVISNARLRAVLSGDKKSRGGRVGWVLPERIGKVDWGREIPWSLVHKVVRDLTSAMGDARRSGFAGTGGLA
jgi:3-dehydroquinate synthase